MDRSRVAIVIPALNESATILPLLETARIYGVPIVVDDGSIDDTAMLAMQAGAVVVSHEKNEGYDAALNSGFKRAIELNMEVVITLDADGQHNPLLLQEYINQITAGADVVFGIRSRRQRVTEHLFAWYTRVRFGIEDPLCGMKAYRTEVYQRLGHFDSYGSVGTELAIFAATNKYKLSQIPIRVLQRKGDARFGRTIIGNYKIFRALIYLIWRSSK